MSAQDNLGPQFGAAKTNGVRDWRMVNFNPDDVSAHNAAQQHADAANATRSAPKGEDDPHKHHRVQAEHQSSMIAYSPSKGEGRRTAFQAAMWAMALESTANKHTRRTD